MNTHTSHLNTQLDDIAARRRAIQKLIIALKKIELSSLGYKAYSRSIRSLRKADLRLRRAEFTLRLEHSSDHITYHQPLCSSQGVTTSPLAIDDAEDFSSVEPVAAADSNANASAGTARNADADTGAGGGDVGVDGATIAGNLGTDADTAGNASDNTDVSTSTEIDGGLNDLMGIEVMSSYFETQLTMESYYAYRCDVDTLQGAYYGSFGNTDPHSIVAYGPRHLSSWSHSHSHTPSDLTKYLPECYITSLVPLSGDVLGLVANVKTEGGNYKRDQVLIFDINSALDDESWTTSPSFVWPKISPHSAGMSIVSKMYTEDNHTYFLSSELNSNGVYVNSFIQENGAFVGTTSDPICTSIESQVNALCFGEQDNIVVSGSIHGQISVTDGTTGGLICDGLVDTKLSRFYRPKITSLAFCPTNQNLVMACCSTLNDQIKIFDLRSSTSPVLTCGVDLVSKYLEELVPTWDPYSGVVVAPFGSNQTRDGNSLLALFDTRFVGIRKTEARAHYLSRTRPVSVSFSTANDIDHRMLVTAEIDGAVSMFNYDQVVKLAPI